MSLAIQAVGPKKRITIKVVVVTDIDAGRLVSL